MSDVRSERLVLHGNDISYLAAGEGDPILFVHGIAGSCTTFDTVLPAIAREHRVIAPDLLGHGSSAKPKGDYSLGAHASGLRDLLDMLEIPSATIVGHSLGGGIAMQFAYQFPERCDRLVLVDSGGFGPEVTGILKAATLPGSELVISLITKDRVKSWTRAAIGRVRGAGVERARSFEHVAQHLECLADKENRRAFVETARTVLDLRGQKIDCRNRLYLAQGLPSLIVWGGRDRFIPVTHAGRAHEAMIDSRLEIFESAGHFPHRDEPERFVRVLLDFIATTDPARITSTTQRVLAEQLVQT